MSRLSRPRLAGLVAVLVLVVAALLLGLLDRPAPHASGAPDAALAQARAAAALPACPSGITPDLPVRTLPCYAGGRDVAVQQPPGRPTVVNLWATWCGPCVEEVPELVEFAARAGDRVGMVGIVQEDTPASVYAFAKEFGIRYPLIADVQGVTMRHYGPGPPITLFVAADGTVAHVQVGAFPTLAALEDAVATHLGVQV